jgi:hypothetical protein
MVASCVPLASMRSTLLAFALLVAPAAAQEGRIRGFGPYVLGAAIDETLITAESGSLEQFESGNSVQRLFRGTSPTMIGGHAFALRLQFEPDRLGVISLTALDDSAAHTQCLQRFRAVIAELEQSVGPLDGARTSFEQAWPAPSVERLGRSEIRSYAFPQHRGAMLHRAVASAHSGGVVEVTAWAWDGGVHRTPIPVNMPGARAACRLSVEIKTA